MRTIFLLLFFVATSTASDVIFKWENYKPVKMTRKLPDKSSEERKWEPIRYRVFYDDSVFDDIPVSQTKLLQKVIKRALKFFDVKVQREEEFSIYKSLNVNTSKYENMCEDTVLSNKYDFYECAEGTEEKGCDDEGHKTLKNIDYVWFVLIEDRPSFAATAGPCNYFPGTNMKPNVGLLNVGRATLSDAESRITREGEENLYNILRHEMSHALFFNEIFFMKAFPDSANLFKKTTRSIVYSETLGSGMNETFYGIAFPKALEEARKYLECPDLQYIELENSGDEATAGSHYDVDFLPYETMRSDIAPFRIAYSRISLALMEDSGWYKVDYSKAEPMQPPLSKDACRAAKSCKFSDYKGQLNFTTKCDTDRKGYLGMPHKSKFADCPVPQHIICSYTYGSEDWKCLEHEVILFQTNTRKAKPKTFYNGLCYEIICNEGSFQFVSGQDYFDCKKEGDKVTFKQNYGINNHFRHLYEQTTETVLNNITFLSNYTAERTVICPKYCEVCAEKDPKTCKEEEAEEEEEEEDEVCDDD